ncbi:hypothetical protein SAMN05444004_1204 [Jannaschia faecimaris]|uniref:Uncharacterized protein n=1 Tax=Jannaschia faecimaris TaxID=1244108 RepID=A0A1H3TXQ1_9RHOB|nr:hypothetical protein [Jannaschia faecimaris]SDZ54029.1 hypothetical protein SAMN05444004_1204 [Jannaschia faecimaris]
MVFALLFLPILALFIAILYVMSCGDGGPGIYGHTRIGRNSRTIREGQLSGTMLQLVAVQDFEGTQSSVERTASDFGQIFHLESKE